MNTSAPALSPTPLHPAWRTRALLGGAVATACLLGLPAAAQASSRPLAAVTSSALCSGVSAGQVSAVVGWTVPAATTSVNSDYFDQALNIHEKDVTCSYAKVTTSVTALEHNVALSYETLSKPPSRLVALRDIKSSFAKAAKDLPPGSSITYSLSHTFGVTSIFSHISDKVGTISFTFEFAYGWSGTKVAGGWVESPLPKAKVQGLEKLALDNFGM